MFICFDPWISYLGTYSKDITQIMGKAIQEDKNHNHNVIYSSEKLEQTKCSTMKKWLSMFCSLPWSMAILQSLKMRVIYCKYYTWNSMMLEVALE